MIRIGCCIQFLGKTHIVFFSSISRKANQRALVVNFIRINFIRINFIRINFITLSEFRY